MSKVYYTAIREIASDHTDVTSYTLQFNCSVRLPTVKSKSVRAVSLSGEIQTTFHRSEKIWKITIPAFHENELQYYQEFWHSVVGGEVFTWWPTNDETVSYNVIVETPGNNPFAEVGLNQYYSMSFELREV